MGQDILDIQYSTMQVCIFNWTIYVHRVCIFKLPYFTVEKYSQDIKENLIKQGI